MSKDDIKEESLPGHNNVLALDGQKTFGLSGKNAIKLKAMGEYGIVIENSAEPHLYKSKASQNRTIKPADFAPGDTVPEYQDFSEHSFRHKHLEGIRFNQNKLLHCDFSGTFLSAAVFKVCDLSGVNFTHANLNDCIFDGCNLDGADLRNANLQGARIVDCHLFAANFDQSSLKGAVIERCSMGAQSFHNANCSGMKLNNSTIIHGFFNDADLSGAELHNMVFRNCTLSNTHFDNALLEDCQFRGCDSFQSGPVFSGGTLNNVMMMDCEFQVARMVRTHISNSIMTRVALESALLEGTSFDKVIFQEGELKECYSLDQGPVFTQCRLDHVLINQAELTNARFDRSSFIGAIIRDSDFNSWTMNHTGLDSETIIEWES